MQPMSAAATGVDWWRQAACAGMDLVLFYGPPTEEEPGGYREPADQRAWRMRRALQVCALCPVREPCREEELAHGREQQFGIRGGMTARQRQRERGNRARGLRQAS